MHFHWCGNILHDIIHNSLVLLALMPETVPICSHARRWAINKFQEWTAHGRESTGGHAPPFSLRR